MESISRGGSSNNFTTLLAMRESDKQNNILQDTTLGDFIRTLGR
jgi:hypothetical protein|eukprot:SAG25_NODE_8141_length_437_cov_0.982249_1_plen_44_part_00